MPRSRLRGETCAAPELVDLEVVSVLRRQNWIGVFDNRRAVLAMSDLQALPIQRAAHRPVLARCWELRANLTTYDAAYVALAEALGTTLLTGESTTRPRLRAPCTIELFTCPS